MIDALMDIENELREQAQGSQDGWMLHLAARLRAAIVEDRKEAKNALALIVHSAGGKIVVGPNMVASFDPLCTLSREDQPDGAIVLEIVRA